MQKTPVVETRNLSLSLRRTQVIKHINLSVYPGEVVGIIGDNAAGKSTLVNTIMGLHSGYEGEVLINGTDGRGKGVSFRRDQGIEIVYQEYAVVPHMRVWQNFFLGRELTKKIGPFMMLKKRRMRSVTRKQLVSHGFSASKPENLMTGKLSGGQRQLLAVLRACTFCTRLVILDEPTAALDEHEVKMVFQLIKELKEQGISVIFVTHKEHEMFDIVDRFFVIRRGRENYGAAKKSTLLRQVDSLLVTSRVMAVRDIISEISMQFSLPVDLMEQELAHLKQHMQTQSDNAMCSELMDTMAMEIESLKSTIIHFTSIADEMVLHEEQFLLGDIIRRTAADVEYEIHRPIDIMIDVPEHLSCRCDPFMLRQVLVNLLINAAEASDEGACIAVSAGKKSEEDTDIWIAVRDWGCGIESSSLKEIFNPFHTTKTANSGLGLSIIHKLLEHMGGSITCESCPCKGSTFTVYLKEDGRDSDNAFTHQ